MPRLERLFLKRAHRGPMDERPALILVAGRGVAGSADQGGRRQVSILSREDWEDAVREAGGDADPAARRANLLVSGVALRGRRGQVLAIGPARLRLLGELTPCERMDEALPGLQDALRPAWRGGVFAEVLVGGEIRAGDEVALEAAG
jgi:MOSC domain-containing protein YiiM